jgi:fused signal recognition particle receptor
MTDEVRECYRLLEVNAGAPLELVKEAYREQLKIWHPDRFSADDGKLQRKATEKTKALNLAYQTVVAYLGGSYTESRAWARASAAQEEKQAKERAEARAREEAARKAKAAEAKQREEAARSAREAQEQRRQDEDLRRAREAAEARQREEAARRAKESAEAQWRAEELTRIRLEAKRKAREEAEARQREEDLQRYKHAAETKQREEAAKLKEEQRQREWHWKYLLKIGDWAKGPYTLEELRVEWLKGNIPRNSQYWTAALNDWAPINGLVDQWSGEEASQREEAARRGRVAAEARRREEDLRRYKTAAEARQRGEATKVVPQAEVKRAGKNDRLFNFVLLGISFCALVFVVWYLLFNR